MQATLDGASWNHVTCQTKANSNGEWFVKIDIADPAFSSGEGGLCLAAAPRQ